MTGLKTGAVVRNQFGHPYRVVRIMHNQNKVLLVNLETGAEVRLTRQVVSATFELAR